MTRDDNRVREWNSESAESRRCASSRACARADWSIYNSRDLITFEERETWAQRMSARKRRDNRTNEINANETVRWRCTSPIPSTPLDRRRLNLTNRGNQEVAVVSRNLG